MKSEKDTDVLFLIFSEGLGDTIAATPAIRYFCEQFSRKVDVWTRHPELFKYSKYVSKIHAGFDPDQDWLKQWHLANIKTPFWKNSMPHPKLRHYHSHLVDYCSVNALGVTLQNKDKHFHVPYSLAERTRSLEILGEAINSSKTIVLHPSDTWKTRRMPEETWRGVATMLVEAGWKVYVVGRDTTNRMPLVLNKVEGVTDLVNQLSVLETIALMDNCKFLLTMDSGSICFGGCTDTHIVGVFTVNPPEFRAPYRKGSYEYKLTVANRTPKCIYCGIPLNRVDMVLGNCINYSEPMCCLPSPEEIFRSIKSAWEHQYG